MVLEGQVTFYEARQGWRVIHGFLCQKKYTAVYTSQIFKYQFWKFTISGGKNWLYVIPGRSFAAEPPLENDKDSLTSCEVPVFAVSFGTGAETVLVPS